MADRVASIDIGTNSTRLLVAESGGAGTPLVTVERLMRITRLGQGVDHAGTLTPDAIDRTVAVLASKLANGDAGGAVLNNLGEVIGMAFAVAPDRPTTAYAVPTVIFRSFLADVDAGNRGKVPGACLQRR